MSETLEEMAAGAVPVVVRGLYPVRAKAEGRPPSGRSCASDATGALAARILSPRF